MSWCAAVGCGNQTKNCKDKNISFFLLPKEKKLREKWITSLKRTQLPKKVYVCSAHFNESDFDVSYKLKQELLGDASGTKRKLLPESVPSIFQHKIVSKVRKHSEKRQELTSHREVTFFNILINSSLFIFSLTTYFPALLNPHRIVGKLLCQLTIWCGGKKHWERGYLLTKYYLK